ncbi:hypothetical protein B0T18DRAFT_409721 [Schizothecium vesticola]|uniref:Secreted protein n=1 Tax=Schizothecium vesticola TaxID=314040 RepID=A0AA40EU23_9PEZI|nr:hypothetical protein B0T18DRAFT_409721 [Schizothecium vesticola]
MVLLCTFFLLYMPRLRDEPLATSLPTTLSQIRLVPDPESGPRPSVRPPSTPNTQHSTLDSPRNSTGRGFFFFFLFD